jgi:hypothetical protein
MKVDCLDCLHCKIKVAAATLKCKKGYWTYADGAGERIVKLYASELETLVIRPRLSFGHAAYCPDLDVMD